mgnify:CR=1 FL=1
MYFSHKLDGTLYNIKILPKFSVHLIITIIIVSLDRSETHLPIQKRKVLKIQKQKKTSWCKNIVKNLQTSRYSFIFDFSKFNSFIDHMPFLTWIPLKRQSEERFCDLGWMGTSQWHHYCDSMVKIRNNLLQIKGPYRWSHLNANNISDMVWCMKNDVELVC